MVPVLETHGIGVTPAPERLQHYEHAHLTVSE